MHSIACAILTADEPTGNLDSRTAEVVLRLFEKLVDGGKTILMVTHDSDLAARAQTTLAIADGEIVDEKVNGVHAGVCTAPSMAAASRQLEK